MRLLNLYPFPEVITNRLLIRQLERNDALAIFNLRSNPLLNKYLDRTSMQTLEDATAFIFKINNGIKNNQWIYWAITLKDNSDLIGTICLWNFSNGNTVADIGYELHPDFQGKGYMSEALKIVLKYASETLSLTKIEAHTHPENIASKNLLLNNDFLLNQKIMEKKFSYLSIFERLLK